MVTFVALITTFKRIGIVFLSFIMSDILVMSAFRRVVLLYFNFALALLFAIFFVSSRITPLFGATCMFTIIGGVMITVPMLA